MDLGIKGKRALVFGSSAGMGRGVAEALAAEGVDVVITSRYQDKLDPIAAEMASKYGVRVEAKACDLGKDGDLDELLDFTMDRFGGIDIQFNNCGGPPRLLPGEADLGLWREWFEIIVVAAIKATGTMLPGMRERQWGRVLCMTSSNLIFAKPDNVMSGSLRMAVSGWAKALSQEVGPDGVTVNCLVPGRIYTERVILGDKTRAERQGVTPEDINERMRLMTPMRRNGTVEEMAATAAFLSSQQAGYITGSVIRVDGGKAQINL